MPQFTMTIVTWTYPPQHTSLDASNTSLRRQDPSSFEASSFWEVILSKLNDVINGSLQWMKEWSRYGRILTSIFSVRSQERRTALGPSPCSMEPPTY